MKRQLFFTENLEIPNGRAEVPAMLWLANKRSLKIFALSSNRRPTEKTEFFYAPFFNVYENGNVCMGTVDVNIQNSTSLEEFIKKWEDYFFNSYFSHLMNEHNPINGNCVSLWKSLINKYKPFPKEASFIMCVFRCKILTTKIGGASPPQNRIFSLPQHDIFQ